MSTNSTIAVVREDGQVAQIYCHWDGYIEHNGRMLVDHYNTQELAEELVSLGDLSQLCENIHPRPGEIHAFRNAQAGVCVYYGRDRHETDVDVRVFQDLEEYNLKYQSQEYNYLFEKGRWFCHHRRHGLVPVREAVDSLRVKSKV